MRKISTRTIAAAVATVALGGAGIAYAAWTTEGHGTAEAKAATAQNMTVSPAEVDGELSPGNRADLVFKLTNPNSYRVHVAEISFGDVTVDGEHEGCAPESVVPDATKFRPFDINAKTSNERHAVHDGISMIADAPQACQGATFTVVVNLTGASAASTGQPGPDGRNGRHHHGATPTGGTETGGHETGGNPTGANG